MTQPKTNKRALLTSALSLLLCCTMLIGTTWAWFTDSVTSAGNKIQSGTLKVDMLVKGGNTGYTDYKSVKNDSNPVFNSNLWEPGYTLVTNVKVVNEGNLALKYTLKFVSGENIATAKLAEAIDVYYVASEVTVADRNTLAGVTPIDLKTVFEQGPDVVINDNLGAGEEDYATIVLKMRESAGNEYQGLTIPAFDICLLATQWTYEEDTFDKNYDELADATPDNAGWPYVTVSTAADLKKILESGESAKLASDINFESNEYIDVNAGKTAYFDLNGHTLSVNEGEGRTGYVIRNKGTLVISDSSSDKSGKITNSVSNPDMQDIPSYATNTISNYGTLVINGGTIENTGAGYACFVVDCYSGSNFTMNDGKLVQDSDYHYALRMFPTSQTNDDVVTINGGTIEGGYALWLQYPNGNANKATLNINGGTFNARDGRAVYAGAAGNSRNSTNVNISITGGTVNGTGAWFGTDTTYQSFSVTGGTFESIGVGVAGGNGLISGGTVRNTGLLSQTRDENSPIIADGYTIVENTDGTYSVVAE